MKEKTPLLLKCVCFQMSKKILQKFRPELKPFNNGVRNYLFLINYVPSEGAAFNNVLYHQQLSIARYEARFVWE